MEFTYFLAFNRLVSKFFYRIQTRLVAADDVVFLNIGYEEDPPMALPLAESDEPNRFHIQLYHRIATQADLSGKRVLEVGCGHGGGASYLMRTLRPASYTGLDLNRAGIAFCRKRHNLLGVDFVHGDAEKLPFPDQSFDAVINVESSAAYPHFSRFLAEVARVLRPGGHFLYADLRPRDSIAEWEAALAGAPMRMLSHEDINAQVAARDGEEYAADTGPDRPRAEISAPHWPRILRRGRHARSTAQCKAGSTRTGCTALFRIEASDPDGSTIHTTRTVQP